MKRFLMIAVAGLLALAAYKPAEATTLDPGDSMAISTGPLTSPPPSGIQTFAFTLSSAVNTTIEIFANIDPFTPGSSISLLNPTLLALHPGGNVVVAPTTGGLSGNTFAAIYSNLAAGDYEFFVTETLSGKASVSGFIAAAPIPPALLMFVTALAGLSLFGYRRKNLGS